MICRYCTHHCHKKGRQKNGKQKYRCVFCKKYQQEQYSSRAYQLDTDKSIVLHLKEGCGIRSISRLLQISVNTVLKRIRKISGNISKPPVPIGKDYEMDEMRTYIRKKTNLYWVVYALQKDNQKTVDFTIGRRTRNTLQRVSETLLLAKANKVFTDGLGHYRFLFPRKMHIVSPYKINRIERMNLTLRTHLKRLNRKTICFSKSAAMLAACLKIYFWG